MTSEDRAGVPGTGIGSKLHEKEGIWTIVSRVFPENITTLKLHYKCGFRSIGTFFLQHRSI